MFKSYFVLFIGLSIPLLVNAQKSPLPQYLPAREQVLKSYAQAASMDSAVINTVFKTDVKAIWKPDGSGFIFKNVMSKDGCIEFIYIDVKSKSKTNAFDSGRLAEALTSFIGKPFDATKLRLNGIIYAKDGKNLLFQVDNQWLEFDPLRYSLSKAMDREKKPVIMGEFEYWRRGGRRDNLSPDKKWIAFIKEGNIFVKPVDGSAESRLSIHGTKEKPFDGLKWSPDSKHIISYLSDPKEIKKVYYLLTSQPNTTRAELKSHDYAQPGEEFTSYEMHTFDVLKKRGLRVKVGKIDFLGMPQLHWEKDGRHVLYAKTDRGHQRYRVIEVDAFTGETRTIIDEKTSTFIYEQRTYTHYLPDTDEMLWSSEKDGWRHLYLVDTKAGKVKSQITKGNWIVRTVDSVDRSKREVWFSASGINQGEDPYYIHHYRIGFNGKNLITLNTARATHQVTYSPDSKYYLDTYSTISTAPITELHRTTDGSLVMEVERADMSALTATGMKLPEVFVSKARDGKTDIWGILCRPSQYDSLKSYPVIEYIYAGPQDSFVPKNFRSYSEMQSIAELGFMVVMMDGMGTANRSKAFHDTCWKNLADGGFPDRILWIKALAAKYDYIDTKRVGIYGTSAGGQNSLGALLFHPEFYTAGVSACGCHDNRVDKQWWNEQWMGFPIGPHYEQQSNVTNARKLKGKLLLIVGEADTNVPPESTYRVADALIKANKNFELLTVPGMGHSDGGPYGRRKLRDFFVKSLLQVDPPDRNQ
ncbi:S9 family peptidase [Arcticibacter eurypsychrophilus]|uniref:S9 family peptidase n=1 Tax=Arcticibacter eurypsychrophilus TaxID=1434752 RepID=UPI00084DA8BC|nr:S9 family peptidase [Arcticibacter eurypsychrophilus]